MYLINEIEFIALENDEYFMVNLINAAADVINKNLYKHLCSGEFSSIDNVSLELLKSRKYLFASESEYNKFILNINHKIEILEKESTPAFLIIPTYACNLKCIYCYEQTYMIKGTSNLDPFAMVDLQFKRIDMLVTKWIRNTGKTDDIRVTIMGGEPLLKCNLKTIEYIFKSAKERDYSIDIVTNGVDLNYYIDLFQEYSDILKYIQITLDGVKEIHDQRRIFHDGKGSFDLILENMRQALQKSVKIYLRVNVDSTNINELPLLADTLVQNFGDNENLEPYLYLLQDGGCSGETNIVNEKVGIESIFQLEEKHSNMKIFHKKFHPAEFIDSIFDDKPYQPVLRHCGAAKNQFIFDCKANVYKCWHGIGNNSYRIGTFDDKYDIDKEKEELWRNRSVNNLEKCKKCKYRYICGTGCPAATHMDESAMDVSEPSCVDYKELIATLIKEKLKRNP